MEVNPSDQDALYWQLLQVLQVFSLLSQSKKFRTVNQINCLSDNLSHDLPDNSQNQVMLLLNKGRGSDAWQSDTQTLSCIQS
jgi:hypothetical protein